jgi:hypothetical protein
VVAPLDRMVPYWPAESERAPSYEISRYSPPHAT